MHSMDFIPETLSLLEFWLLVGTSFFTSALTAAVGIGGGVALLAVMAQLVPTAAIVPVHGIVQLGSNVGRAGLMRRDIDRKLLLYFVGGSLIGAAIGGQIVVALPTPYLQLALALFILYATWGPKPVAAEGSVKTLAIGGAFSTLLTMFVGATGPFVAALIKPMQLGKLGQVATMSACMVIQHALKVLVFGLLGFSFAPYLPLMALMIAFGFVGTLAGRGLLDRISEKHFKTGLNMMLTLLALRLLWVAARALY
jgi:uncharacterized protein